jgi:AraC-like DNA-binding protein
MLANPDRAEASVVGIVEQLDGIAGAMHKHTRAQLIHAAEGVLVVTTELGSFVVPPQRAVWVTAGERHRVEARQRVTLATLYFATDRVVGLPTSTAVIHVSSLLGALIREAVGYPWNWATGSPEARLVRVLVDQLRTAEVAPLTLPRPRDRRVARACAAIADDPSLDHRLDDLARVARTSPRQLGRLFVQETGMSPAAYREQLRLLRGLERIGAGESILAVALDLGYASASSFGVMFKRALGTSPGRYFPSAPGAGTPAVGAPRGTRPARAPR